MPFRSLKVTRLNYPTKQSVWSLHPSSVPSQPQTVIAELLFDFSTVAQGGSGDTSIQFDFTSNNFVKNIPFRSIYIDLKDTDNNLLVQQFQDTNYGPISLVGRSQGWIPILWTEPMHILVTFFGGAQAPFIVLRFANELIPGPIWRTQ